MRKKRMIGRRCYDHLGGALGAALLETYLANGWLAAEEGKTTVYRVTEAGREAFAKMGLVLDPETL